MFKLNVEAASPQPSERWTTAAAAWALSELKWTQSVLTQLDTIILPGWLSSGNNILKYSVMGCISCSSRSIRLVWHILLHTGERRGRRGVDDRELQDAFYHGDQLEEFTGQATWEINAIQFSKANSEPTVTLWANHKSRAKSKCTKITLNWGIYHL